MYCHVLSTCKTYTVLICMYKRILPKPWAVCWSHHDVFSEFRVATWSSLCLCENWHTCPWKKRGNQECLEAAFVENTLLVCLCLGALEVLRDQTDKRWLIGSRLHVSFQPCLGSYYREFSYFLLSPFTCSVLKPPYPTSLLFPSFNPACVFFPLSKQIWVGSFN